MKKLIALMTLIVVSLILLTACDNQNGGSKGDQNGDRNNVHSHSYGDWRTTKIPTCTEDGMRTRYCECGAEKNDPIYAAGHNFSDWVIVEDATETETGVQERYCDCGEKESGIIEKIVYSQGLSFKLNSDGNSYSVSGLGSCTDRKLVIPDSYEGLPVTGIDNYMFRHIPGISSVRIPGTIKVIDFGTFGDCIGLTSVVICDGVTAIESTAFLGGENLKNLVIPDSVTSIGSHAFYGCESLSNIVIGNGVTSIEQDAFMY